MATARRRFFLAAQWIFATVVVWSAYRALNGQWKVAAERLATIHVAWAWVAAATVIVFLTYLLLIETWRQVIIASGETLSFPVAARIWFISNLGKYVPGKVWSIAAMTVMARDQAVSPVMAAGSSVLVQLLSVATGVAVVFAAGSRAIQNQWLAVGLLAIVAAFVAAVPRLLPFASRAAASMTGKKVELPMIAAKTRRV